MTEDDIKRENPNDGWYRRKIGRRIELGANRLIGLVLGAVSAYAVWLAADTDGLVPADDWPEFALAAVMLFLSYRCFAARTGVIKGFGEEMTGTEPLLFGRRK